ncbi:hypothetical protein ES703_38573 [subsurface metagenome]
MPKEEPQKYIPMTKEHWDSLDIVEKLDEITDAIGRDSNGKGIVADISLYVSKFDKLLDALWECSLTTDKADTAIINEAGGELLRRLQKEEMRLRILLGPEPWKALEMPNPELNQDSKQGG